MITTIQLSIADFIAISIVFIFIFMAYTFDLGVAILI
jgi:hypothetical protein